MSLLCLKPYFSQPACGIVLAFSLLFSQGISGEEKEQEKPASEQSPTITVDPAKPLTTRVPGLNIAKRGRVYLDMKNRTKAIEAFNQALAENPKLPDAYFGLALVEFDAKNAPKGLELIEKTLSLDANYLDAILKRGTYFLERDDFALAEKDFLKATTIDPKKAEFWKGLSLAQIRLEKYKEALESCTKTLEFDRENLESRFFRGFCYDRLGQYGNAIQDYTRLIEKNPRDANLFTFRSRAYTEIGDWAQGILDADVAISLEPRNSPAWMQRGLAKFYEGDIESGIRDMSRAIEITPDYVDAYIARGVARHSLGQEKSAREDFVKAAELDPDQAERLGRMEE